MSPKWPTTPKYARCPYACGQRVPVRIIAGNWTFETHTLPNSDTICDGSLQPADGKK